MEVREIKSIHDILLAYHNKRKLMNKAGKYFKIINIYESKTRSTPGYYVVLQWHSKYEEHRLDELIKNFKIVLINNKENKMEGYIERMIQEHKELVVRIDKLHTWVYGDAYKQVDATEFANECIQLKGMKIYEEALRARLYNAGVKIMGVDYLVAIDSIEEEENDEQENHTDND